MIQCLCFGHTLAAFGPEIMIDSRVEWRSSGRKLKTESCKLQTVCFGSIQSGQEVAAVRHTSIDEPPELRCSGGQPVECARSKWTAGQLPSEPQASDWD